MSGDINVQTFSGKVNITSNLLVGSSHLFVDTTNNRVGITTASPGASLEVNGNVHVVTDLTFGGTLTGNGSGLTNVNSDSGSWVNGSSSNIHLAVSTDNVGIGTDSPAHKLDVDGDINISSGSTLKVGGTPAVFSNWSVNGSDIYRSSGNVGIGVTPGVALDVAGTIRGTGGIITGTSDTVLTVTNTTTPAILRTLTTGGQVFFQSGTATTSDSRANINFTSMYNATNYLTIEGSTGYVGIGTSPGTNLEIRGNNPGLRLSDDGLDNPSWNFRGSDANSEGFDIRYRKGSTIDDRFLFFGSRNIIDAYKGFIFYTPTGTQCMRIDKVGKVSVNVDQYPNPSLDVNGYIKQRNSFFFVTDYATSFTSWFRYGNNIKINNGSHFNTSTRRYTAPVKGLYLFSFTGYTVNHQHVGLGYNADYVDWNNYNGCQLWSINGGTGGTTSWFLQLNANDYVTLILYASGNLSNARHYFSGGLIYAV